MELREFNQEGNKKYLEWLETMKFDDQQDLPNHLLDNDEYTKVIGASIENRSFSNTREFGEYLDSIVDKEYMGSFGVWNWLSCFYLDQFLPLKKGIRKKPGSLNRYVVTEGAMFTNDPFRRHLAAMPGLFAKAHRGEDDILDVILSQNDIGKYGDMQEQPLATQEYYYCRPILKTLNELYWDDGSGKLKKSASTHVRRFIVVIGSIGFTHDFNKMTVDQIMEVLPPEFDEWNT